MTKGTGKPQEKKAENLTKQETRPLSADEINEFRSATAHLINWSDTKLVGAGSDRGATMTKSVAEVLERICEASALIELVFMASGGLDDAEVRNAMQLGCNLASDKLLAARNDLKVWQGAYRATTSRGRILTDRFSAT